MTGSTTVLTNSPLDFATAKARSPAGGNALYNMDQQQQQGSTQTAEPINTAGQQRQQDQRQQRQPEQPGQQKQETRTAGHQDSRDSRSRAAQ
jgi:hypothetical protein